MRNRSLVISLIAMAVLIGGAVLYSRSSYNPNAPTPVPVVKQQAMANATCMVTGDKVGFVNDQRVAKILEKDEYRVKSVTLVSDDLVMADVDVVDAQGTKPDCMWPTTIVTLDRLKARDKRDEFWFHQDNTFGTYLVVASWKEVVDCFLKIGLARQAGDTYYLNTPALYKAISEGKKWSDCGLPYAGNISVMSADPKTSGSGMVWASLNMGIALEGKVYSKENVAAAMPSVERILARERYLPTNTKALIDKFFATNPGTTPLAVVNENQLIEFVNGLQDQADKDRVKNEIRIMIPEPTVYLPSPITSKTTAGQRFVTALQSDPEMKRIAADHGYRTGFGGTQFNQGTLQYLGLPERYNSVVDLPNYGVISQMLAAFQ